MCILVKYCKHGILSVESNFKMSKSNFYCLPLKLQCQYPEVICVEQEEQETLVQAAHNFDGVGLTVQPECYWTLEVKLLSWGS